MVAGIYVTTSVITEKGALVVNDVHVELRLLVVLEDGMNKHSIILGSARGLSHPKPLGQSSAELLVPVPPAVFWSGLRKSTRSEHVNVLFPDVPSLAHR